MLFLNYIINNNLWSLVDEYGLDQTYFPHWSSLFNYIKTYVDTYHQTPDKAQVLSLYSDFEIYDTESCTADGLVDSLRLDKFKGDITKWHNDFAKTAKDAVLNSNMLGDVVDAITPYAEKFNNILTDSYQIKAMNSVDISTLLKDKFISRAEHKEEFIYPTGFKFFDDTFHGWDRDNDYVVISGRPGTGKSMMLCLLAAEQLRLGKKVVFYEGEMDVAQTMERVIAHLSHLSETDMLLGKSEIQSEYFNQIEKWLANDNFYIITPQMLNGKYATAGILEALCKKVGAEVLFIDQQSLMEDMDGAKTFYEKASNISRQIKGIRDRLNIPVITAVQQNRTKVENGGVDTTQIAGSDIIVQDASKVIMLSVNLNKENVVKVCITKNRNGKSYVDKDFETDFAHCDFKDGVETTTTVFDSEEFVF